METNNNNQISSERKRESPNIINGSRKLIVILLVCFIVFVIILFHHFTNLHHTRQIDIMRILSLPFGYLMFKIILTFFYKPADVEVLTGEDAYPFTVSAIMPCYNEDAISVISAMESLLSQTYPLEEIIFVDDGTPIDEESEELSTYESVLLFIESHELTNHPTKIIAHRSEVNLGKVHAQAWGFLYTQSDLIMTVDSDGVMNDNALEELVKVFASDEAVGSAVGYIASHNLESGFVTKVQDMNYSGAFSVGRASQSVLNSVVVCSGAMSLHRRSIVIENMEDYLKEDALKITVGSGDDRRLTRLSKINGFKTKYQSTAICYTNTPEKRKMLVKQRVRWTRSSWIYSVQNFLVVPWSKFPYLLFSFMESYLWLINLLLWLFGTRNIETSLGFWIHAAIYYVLMNYLNTVYYVFHKPVRYLLSPIYGLYYGILLFWIYFKTTLRLFKSGWGTRDTLVKETDEAQINEKISNLRQTMN